MKDEWIDEETGVFIGGGVTLGLRLGFRRDEKIHMGSDLVAKPTTSGPF